MNEVEQYFESLFKDPAFGFVLGIASIWYSYYLYKRPLVNNDLCFITMSNYHKKSPRQTEMILLNESDRDITSDDLLIGGCPLLIKFAEDINVMEFRIKKTSKSVGKHGLIKKSVTDYEFKFDIIKKGQGIVFMAIHDSKKHELTWKDIKISGILKNFDLTRDDFSDQMIYRANSVYILISMGCFLVATVFAFSFKTFFAAGNINVPFPLLVYWGDDFKFFFCCRLLPFKSWQYTL